MKTPQSPLILIRLQLKAYYCQRDCPPHGGKLSALVTNDLKRYQASMAKREELKNIPVSRLVYKMLDDQLVFNCTPEGYLYWHDRDYSLPWTTLRNLINILRNSTEKLTKSGVITPETSDSEYLAALYKDTKFAINKVYPYGY